MAAAVLESISIPHFVPTASSSASAAPPRRSVAVSAGRSSGPMAGFVGIRVSRRGRRVSSAGRTPSVVRRSWAVVCEAPNTAVDGMDEFLTKP